MILSVGLLLIASFVLAAAEEDIDSWWETNTGHNVAEFLRILAAIGIAAAAWKGIRYMVGETRAFHVWGLTRFRERKRREVLLDEMLAPDGWPQLKDEVHTMKKDIKTIRDTLLAVHNVVTDATPPPENKE